MRSSGSRFLIVGILALLMFIPLFFVSAVVDERASYSRSTISSVGSEWGGPQLISGPRWVIPVEGPVQIGRTRTTLQPDGTQKEEKYTVTEIRRKQPLFIYPGNLQVSVSSTTEERQRGIFKVPVYTATADIEFDFPEVNAGSVLGENERVLWADGRLELALSSNRSLRGTTRLEIGGQDVALEPISGGQREGIFALSGDPRAAGSARWQVGFNGAQRMLISPVGRQSDIQITSDWPHPSFTGAFLPNGSDISETGFTATWSIPHLARALPQVAREDFDGQARNATAFGVRFFQPNDFYQKAYRAARYGILFIALTFLTVLLIEEKTARPTHPVQYILIGLAQSLFVLLMVAYAEQIGFGPAYLLSAGAVTALLTLYGFIALNLGKRALVMGVMLAVLYAVLYLILRSADYALLAGATLAFAALAATMILTRNEDWYGPPKAASQRRGWFGGPPAPGAPAVSQSKPAAEAGNDVKET